MAIWAALALLLPYVSTSLSPAATLRGCLSGTPGKFYLASSNGQGEFFLLVGNTSSLPSAIGKEVLINGEPDAPTEPYPSFRVTGVEQVFQTPKPVLLSSFADPTNWRTQANRAAGIQFARPVSIPTGANPSGLLQPNFPTDPNVATITRWEIPREIFPHTNFVGGSFALYVASTDAKSCNAFRDAGRNAPTPSSIGGVQYAQLETGGAAAGTSYHYRYLHTFQNSQCFELAFEFAEYNTGNEDLGCRVPVMRPEDEWKLIVAVLAKVSFHPTQ